VKVLYYNYNAIQFTIFLHFVIINRW